MTLRQVHRTLGMVFGPFFLITAATGGLLLWRKADLFGVEAKEGMLGWHNWEGLHRFGIHYLGMLLAAALVMMVVTGAALRLQVWRRTRKRP